MEISITEATAEDAPTVARLVKALTDEICQRSAAHFDVDLVVSTALCRKLIEQGHYRVLLAIEQQGGETVGCATLCESHALYAEGSFGIIQEFYILPHYRSQQIGAQLMAAVIAQARERNWKRLELCTPPLPAFERTIVFYMQNGFEITGGRKMKRVLS
jgi:GNAT superfamily N-acetyltransferase